MLKGLYCVLSPILITIFYVSHIMGCFHSKKEVPDLHPNVFRVVNIDENGADLCSGQLEITETDIILYREGRDTTVWPLHSLRRYGFEGEIFSFESGRRCDTGEGIYAFKCRRAAPLFRTLQQQIQLRNVVHDAAPYPASGLSPLPHGRQTLQASVVHRSSVDNGQPDQMSPAINNNHSHMAHTAIMRSVSQSPRSPSTADILEVTPLYPQSRTNSNHVTNIYQLRDFKREHNNNQSETLAEVRHEYTNDFNRDLAILRNNLKRETALNIMRDIEDETRFLESRFDNEHTNSKSDSNPISPALSNSSEHYAQLSIDQQDGSRLYVNVVQNEINLQEANKTNVVPTTPLTPKQIDYCNLTPSNICSEGNTYANIMLSEKVESVKSVLLNSSEHNHKFSESDTLTSMSPVEELEVNYAVLDIDLNKEGAKANREVSSPENLSYNSSKNESTTSFTTQSRGKLVSQNSTEKAPVASAPVGAPVANVGYTTIDFDKTVALTSVAAGTDVNLEGVRKTRHNSCSFLYGSPGGVEKSRIN